jgi:hypothetical protein
MLPPMAEALRMGGPANQRSCSTTARRVEVCRRGTVGGQWVRGWQAAGGSCRHLAATGERHACPCGRQMRATWGPPSTRKQPRLCEKTERMGGWGSCMPSGWHRCRGPPCPTLCAGWAAISALNDSMMQVRVTEAPMCTPPSSTCVSTGGVAGRAHCTSRAMDGCGGAAGRVSAKQLAEQRQGGTQA